jgi:hypothetical protein
MDERYAFSLLDAYCWKFARLFFLFVFYYTVFLYHSVCICGTRIRLISMNKSVTINNVCFFFAGSGVATMSLSIFWSTLPCVLFMLFADRTDALTPGDVQPLCV